MRPTRRRSLSLLREIVFDTETTGIEHASGDRVVEIGAIELLNHIPTGVVFHEYLNPQRAVHPEALKVHGLTDQFLADKPLFATLADRLRAFFGEATLIAHNASFDVAFLNAEFARTGHPPIVQARVVDSLMLARRKHPGASNSLDALCQRYGIDNARRAKHGALLDSELLAEVYIELIGGKQTSLGLTLSARSASGTVIVAQARDRASRVTISRLSDTERAAHAAFVGGLGENALWRDYLGLEAGA